MVVAATKELRAITEAKVKTDRRDARTLARLLAAGLLTGCWLPDEATRALRRRLARRAQLVRQRTRCKNEVHAVLMRNLKGRPPMTDVFGKRGRAWLTELELPADERETVDGCVRQINFVDGEIAILEQAIAEHALGSADVRRLMTVPGVSLMTATTFMFVNVNVNVVGGVRVEEPVADLAIALQHDLLDGGRIGGIAHALVARCLTAAMARHRCHRPTATSSIQKHERLHDPSQRR